VKAWVISLISGSVPEITVEITEITVAVQFLRSRRTVSLFEPEKWLDSVVN